MSHLRTGLSYKLTLTLQTRDFYSYWHAVFTSESPLRGCGGGDTRLTFHLDLENQIPLSRPSKKLSTILKLNAELQISTYMVIMRFAETVSKPLYIFDGNNSYMRCV